MIRKPLCNYVSTVKNCRIKVWVFIVTWNRLGIPKLFNGIVCQEIVRYFIKCHLVEVFNPMEHEASRLLICKGLLISPPPLLSGTSLLSSIQLWRFPGYSTGKGNKAWDPKSENTIYFCCVETSNEMIFPIKINHRGLGECDIAFLLRIFDFVVSLLIHVCVCVCPCT